MTTTKHHGKIQVPKGLRVYRRNWKRGPFLAHDRGCANGFIEDRRHGAIYGPFRYADGHLAMDWEEASRTAGFCAYCGKR